MCGSQLLNDWIIKNERDHRTNLNPRPTSSTAVRLAIVFSLEASKLVNRSEIILVLNPRQSNSAPSTPKITTFKISKFLIEKAVANF